MLVLTSEERHEQAWRAAHNYPLLTHEALFVLRVATLAYRALASGIPMTVPILVNEAGLKLISKAQAQAPEWQGWPDPYTLFGRPLEVYTTPFDRPDDSADCFIEGLDVPADRIEETVSDLLDDAPKGS